MNLPAVFESHFGLNLGSQIPDDCLFVLGLTRGWTVFAEFPEVMSFLYAKETGDRLGSS